ncbi:MAG: oligosaccharide repeat unit polymerase [Betaproteobacteria bacterium]|nr:oligosaccharide repeat unit polymerase [Betaproteobacteria bacterium]
MPELLLGVCLLGLLVAQKKHLGLANPFTIYFSAWSLIIGLFCLLQSTFEEPSSEFILIILLAKLIVFLLLVIVKPVKFQAANYGQSTVVRIRPKLLAWAQLLTLVLIPFALQRVGELSGGADILTREGYTALRASMTWDGQSLGLFQYISILSFVVSALSLYLWYYGALSIVRAAFSVGVALFYVYIGTGRTTILLLAVSVVIPLVIVGAIRVRGLVVAFASLMLLFSFVALMTGKGVYVDVTLMENIESYTQNLRSYTVAPLLALNEFMKTEPPIEFGVSTFRVIFAMLSFLGFSDIAPVALINDYVYVPDATNVYTVYKDYFLDFSYFGIIIPPLFLIGHWWLYRRALHKGGRWLFVYASTTFPLIMQFFQDQYFSLASLWIQIILWYIIFIKPRASNVVEQCRVR